MTTAEKTYQDIIHRQRPKNPDILHKYPPMSLSERAKIFSPFSALRGLDEAFEDEALKELQDMMHA